MSEPRWPGFDPELSAWIVEAPGPPAGAPVAVMREYSFRNNAIARGRMRPELSAASVHDERVDGPGGPIEVRVFVARETSGPIPLIVYFHGGGWVIGGIDTQLAHAYRQCVQAGAVVVSVGYRCAPEAMFPAAFDDALAATEWAAANAQRLGGDADYLVVCGDSAGGQLATSVAIARRDAGRPLAGQLLLCPVTDAAGRYADPRVNATYPSRALQADGPGLTLAGMAWFADTYLGTDDNDDNGSDWRVSPIHADLRGVAPAVVHTSAFDVLRDEGNQYAEALRAAGVRVIAREYATLNHGYFGLGGVSRAADDAATQAAADLRELLGLSPRTALAAAAPG